MLGFTPVSWMAFVLLGIATLVHITFVNLVLGFSVIIPFTEYLSYRRKDEQLMDVARRTFKYLILTDLVAGVWGTWITIALAGLWPTLTYIATTVLFVPITVALIGILIAIPSIAIYWYTWGKVSRGVHLFVGCLMAFGALLVPAGFRMIFAFVDYPVGLNEALKGNLYAIFANPIYPIWVVWSWFGSLAMSALVAGGMYAWRTRGSKDETGMALKDTAYFLKLGIPFLVITAALGAYFFYSLEPASPYIFAAITGNTGVAHYNFLSISLLYPVLTIIAFGAASALLILARKGKLSKMTSLVLVVSAFLMVPIVEAVNDASRAPYMVITGDTGLPANAFANTMIPISWSIAELAVTIAIVVMSTFLLGIYFIYKVKTSPTTAETI
jgi:cytochrome d ubiquinol oxidase subunit I